ncbi:MAG: hypothetical protein GWN00_06890, partial [Aliifodinibius sp.]|nr:response regulator [Fodinibius sp.]NIV10942.1 hypothetical protein [Fodinibius sp.]NIY24544.1 hypothetical protein [Fodinibius sp.]
MIQHVTLKQLHDTFDMVAATHGGEALALFEKQPFDFVITDMQLPDSHG